MNVRVVLMLGVALAVGCGREATPPVGLNNSCAAAADCLAPLECQDGKCVYPQGLECSSGDKRCNGRDVEVCTADTAAGTFTWAVEKTCATACWGSRPTADCVPQVCAPGETKCDGIKDPNDPTGQTITSAIVLRCNASGTGFDYSESCPAGCNYDGTAKRGTCVPQECEPFETRCDAGDTTHTRIQECDSRGKAYVTRQCTTGEVCAGGECVKKACSVTRDGSGNVTGRQERCSGNVLERCRDDEAGYFTGTVCELGCTQPTGTTAVCSQPGCRTGPGPTDFARAGFARCKPDDTTKRTIQVCNATSTAWEDSVCASPFGPAVCDAGECVPQACSIVGSTREQRCNGRVREECDDTLSSFRPLSGVPVSETFCAYGCFMDGVNARCVSPECDFTFGPNGEPEERCFTQGGQPPAVQRCAIDGKYEFLEYCANGCTGVAGVANCNPLTCTPLARRCALDAASGVSTVEVCNGGGTGFFAIETCDQGCSDGVCIMQNANCRPGEQRCVGANVETCVLLPGGASEWRYTESCVGRCANGACDDGGACGCVGGVSASAGKCGVTSRQPIRLRQLLPANLAPVGALVSLPEVPCDGISRVLFYTDPITDSKGNIVPDGTIVTFTLEDTHASGPRLVSGDLDPDLAGVQRPTYRGRARVLLRSPSPAACAANEPGTVPVTLPGPPPTPATRRVSRLSARVGDRCAGTTEAWFRTQGGTLARRYVYVAEDFSTSTFADRTARGTTMSWDVGEGRAYARPGWDGGDGRDGNVGIDDGQPPESAIPVNLSTTGFARNANVTLIGPDFVEMDVPSIGVSPGDEVLVITVRSGSHANLGVREFHRVAAVEPSRIRFAAPVQAVFGSGSNANLSGSRVMVQRVPNFETLVLPKTESLTTTGVDAGGSGVIAFRVRQTAQLYGPINVNGLGALAPAALPRRAGRLVVAGGDSSRRGGGAVYIHAGRIEHADGGVVDAVTSINANGAGSGSLFGPGGTIELGAGSLSVGTGPRAGDRFVYRAVGGSGVNIIAGPAFNAGSSSGEIRLTYGSISQDFSPIENVVPDPHFSLPFSGASFIFANVAEQCAISPDVPCTIAPSRSGAFYAQSVPVHSEPDSGNPGIRAAQLMGLLAGSESLTAFVSTAANGSVNLGSLFGVQGRASTEGPWAELSSGSNTQFVLNPSQPNIPNFGKQFRWRVRSSIVGVEPVDVLGVAIRLEINNP